MNIFELAAKISLDDSEYKSGVDKAQGTFSKLASGVGKGLVTVAKVGAAAVAAGAAGVAALTKMGIEGYAQYEQLTGGVETLFKTSQDAVMKYAENAYKSSGLSANAYMETATSFAASLIKSLDGDTAKAADVANMAITDMSDNANKMGTDIALIQNAYNGFAKGNFTMLDNLKLGYGGTQKEMERLLKDAQKISGIKYDISSFSDISEAIHVIQTDMEISGLTYEQAMEAVARGEMTMEEAIDKMGATAKEAATTIEGSLNMMKASWENLVVGMADSEADMDTLINNFVESTKIAAGQILPKISTALSGIGKLITELSPVIAEALPQLVEEVLPSLLEAGVSLVTSLVSGIISALPALGEALLEAVEMILVTVFGVSEENASAFSEGVRNALADIRDFFTGVVEQINTDGTWLNEVWTKLQTVGQLLGEILAGAFEAIKTAFTWCVEQINTDGTLLNTIWTILQEGITWLLDACILAFEGIKSAFAAVVEQINTDGTLLNELWTRLQATVEFLREALVDAFEAIKSGFSFVVEQINTDGTWLNEIWTGLQEAAQLFGEFLIALWDAISSAFTWCVESINTEGTVLNTIWETIKSVAETVWTNIQTIISAAVDIIKGIISAFTSVLKGDWSAAWEAVKSIASTAFDAVCSVIGSIVEWITGFLGTMVQKGTELIGSLAEGIQNKFAELFTLVGGWVTDNIINPIGDKVGDVLNKGKEIIDNLKEGMKQAWTSLTSWFNGVWDSLFNRKTKVTNNDKGEVTMTPAKTGLDYVPYDEFPALLHRGEAVLTAAEAKAWRKYGIGGGAVPAMAGGVTINQYIQSVPQTPVELASATEAYFEQARWML